MSGLTDIGGDGIWYVHGKGRYNVTADGVLIAEGGDFGQRERTHFSIPFVPTSQLFVNNMGLVEC